MKELEKRNEKVICNLNCCLSTSFMNVIRYKLRIT